MQSFYFFQKNIKVWFLGLVCIMVYTIGAAQPNIVKAEYFIDTDPGFGSATDIPVTASANIADKVANISLAGVSEGLHHLFLRSKDANGHWSISNRMIFFRGGITPGIPNIVKAEYFIDTDPGFGLAANIPVAAKADLQNQVANINLTSISEGLHNLFIRTQDANGRWSISNRATFFRGGIAAGIASIVKAEYFIDTDPGFGNAANIPIPSNTNLQNQEATINLTGVSEGLHNLFIRTQDANGRWSISNRVTFFRGGLAEGVANVVKAEYFIDTDPGFGLASNIPITAGSNISNQAANISLTGISEGLHNLFIRTQDANGRWSISNRATFFRGGLVVGLPNIVKSEYFIDTDPGFGLATRIPITPNSNLSNFEFDADLAGFTAGSHRFFVRSLDANGKWSITNTDTFFISSEVLPFVTVGNIASPFCAGATVLVPCKVNVPFGVTNEFIVQLSDANGDFGSPVNIGKLTGTGPADISCTIPGGTAAGTAYRIRIVATSPISTSKPSADQLTVNRVPDNNFTIKGPTPVCLGQQSYAASAVQAGASYTWDLLTGGTLNPSGPAAEITWKTTGAHTITLTASNNCGAGKTATLDVLVLNGGPTSVPAVVVNGRQLTATVAVANEGYQWFKDAIAIAGQTSQTYTVPEQESGVYTAAYTNSCGAGLPSSPFAIGKETKSQNLVFDPVGDKLFGDAPFTVTAIASSGLPVTYSIVSGPATIAGNTITITGAGIIVVRAMQEGDINFKPAQAELSITVNKLDATISLSNLAVTYDGAAKPAIATTNPFGLNNSILYDGNPAAPVNAGSYEVLATITSPNYKGSATATLVIAKATQSISLQAIADKSFNDPAFNVLASATSGLPIALTIVTVPTTGVASISGNIITLLGAGGTVSITATQVGNTNYNPAANATTTFNVKPPTANDVQVVSLVSPVNGCGLPVANIVTVKIKNTGTVAASGFNISYSIDGDSPTTETIAGPLASGAEMDYSFTAKASFPIANQPYSVTIFTSLAGDEKTNNDTLLARVTRLVPPATGVSVDTSICAGQPAMLTAFGASKYVWTKGPATAIYSPRPTATTTYTVAVTDIYGCATKSYPVTVTVNANPVANAGNDETILRGSSVNLLASGGIAYKWSNGEESAETTVSPQTTTNYIVTVANAAGCTNTDTTTVNVNFSAITVAPSQYNFSGVVKDSTATFNIAVTNTGTLAETITAINGLAAPFTTSFAAPATLLAGASISIPVQFTPNELLFYQNKFSIVTSAGTFNISLQGRGVEPIAAWTITPADYNFGKVDVGTSVSKTFVIENKGNIPVSYTLANSSSPRFVATLGGGNKTIPVGGSANISIKFSPQAVTAYSGNIVIRTSTPNVSSLKVIVAGNGYIDGALPELLYVNNAPFSGNSGVTPAVGQPGLYTYRIVYRHPDGLAPMEDFPKVGIDKNGDEDFVDAFEGILTLDKEGNGTDWKNGETYTLTTNLGVSELYGYQFFATDINGNDAFLTEFKKGPIVTREILDLHIFADDIVFSKANPAVNEAFTVTATIHNNSPYPAANVNVRLYYKDSLFLLEDIIPFIDGSSTASITKTLSFSPDGFYPIKVWIDSANTLGEGNLLNNYASRPVIVGVFTVPGTIDVVSNASTFGCSKGKAIFSGNAKYRGLNLAGTPPVEGATVTIKIPGFEGGRIIVTNTNINGEWYVYDDPCANDPVPEDCQGYICGVNYAYTVEVTDYTLTSPVAAGSFSRPCISCEKVGTIQHGVSVDYCVLDGNAFVGHAGIANFSLDSWSGQKICAPTVYRDTIDVFIDGKLLNHYTLDSIVSCGTANYAEPIAGLPVGVHNFALSHVYYNKAGERLEAFVSTPVYINPKVAELNFDDDYPTRTGYQSIGFAVHNTSCWNAGAHKVFIYDSMPGYAEKILLDSIVISGLPAGGFIGLGYENLNWEPGCHHVTVVIDARNQVPELNEGNNVGTTIVCVEQRFPDIVAAITGISNKAPAAGSKVNFNFKIINSGLVPVDKPFKLSLKANGVLVGAKITVVGIGVKDTVNLVSEPYTIPFSQCPIEIILQADTEEEIVEIEEIKNNIDTFNFGINFKIGRVCDMFSDEETTGSVTGVPDSLTYCIPFTNTCLKIPDPESLLNQFCFPFYILKGVPSRIETTVRNNGSRDAFNVKVRFTFRGQEIGTDVIPRLKAGEINQHVGFTYAFDTVGNFQVYSYVDYENEVCELNERDNSAPINIGVKAVAADLEILSQYIAPSNLNPNPGQSITVVASVVNKGDGPSTPAKVRFWIDGVQLGDDIAIDSIYAGQDTTVQATASYSSLIVGPKVIKVLADVEFKVLEFNKGNNEATRAIINGDAPDLASSLHEAITISPAVFSVGDSVTISNYLRNYGGAAGVAWLKFSVRNKAGAVTDIDSVQFRLESNDSLPFAIRWKVAEEEGTIITEILRCAPPEFNELNNVDSFAFTTAMPVTRPDFAHSLHEAITINPASYFVGDSITISNYIANYGTAAGTAKLRFSIKDKTGFLTVLDELPFSLAVNDSVLISKRYKVAADAAMVITEIFGSVPAESNVLNNFDSLPINPQVVATFPDFAHSLHEAITINPASYFVGDSITISNYISNFGTAAGTAKLRFSITDKTGFLTVLEEMPFSLAVNDSVLISKRYKVAADAATVITEIFGSVPAESNVANNIDSLPINPQVVATFPDFAHSLHEAITINPASYFVGDSITISNYISNYGTAAGTAKLRFSIIDKTGVLTVLEEMPFSLAINDSVLISKRYKVAADATMVITEIFGSVPAESNVANNIDSLPINPQVVATFPDFAHSLHEAITINSTSYFVGDSITISNYISNYGTAAGTAKLRFSIKDNTGFLTVLDELPFSLAVNDSVLISKRYKVAADAAMVITEIFGSVPAESNVANNVDSLPINPQVVATFPDFAHSLHEAITINPASYFVGDSITISNYISNFGTAAGTAKLRFSIKDKTGFLTVLEEMPFSLAVNDSVLISKRYKVAADAAMVITEIFGSVPAESNVANNIDSLPINPQVVAMFPDFAHSLHEAITINPTSYFVGDSITISNYIANYGTAAGTAKLRFSIKDKTGFLTVLDELPFSLAVNDSVLISKRYKVAADAAMVITEIFGSVPAESNVANNIDSLPINPEISVGTSPDFAHSINEAITITPTIFGVGDSVTLSNYLRNYGSGDGGAWLRFSIRNKNGSLTVVDSVSFSLAKGDSARYSIRWKVAAGSGNIITEIVGSVPAELDVADNIDSLNINPQTTLLSLTGKLLGSNAVLDWQTIGGYNINRFELERSADAVAFGQITTTNANTASGTSNYTYTDASFPQLGISAYYRVKMIDKYESFVYSDTVRIDPQTECALKVFPNPVDDKLNVRFCTAIKGRHTVRIIDAVGRTCLEGRYELLPGSHTLTQQVVLLAKGAYIMLLYRPDGRVEVVKFLKKE